MTGSFDLRDLTTGESLIADSITADATLGAVDVHFMVRINLKPMPAKGSPILLAQRGCAAATALFPEPRANSRLWPSDENRAAPNRQLFNQTASRDYRSPVSWQ